MSRGLSHTSILAHRTEDPHILQQCTFIFCTVNRRKWMIEDVRLAASTRQLRCMSRGYLRVWLIMKILLIWWVFYVMGYYSLDKQDREARGQWNINYTGANTGESSGVVVVCIKNNLKTHLKVSGYPDSRFRCYRSGVSLHIIYPYYRAITITSSIKQYLGLFTRRNFE